MEWGFFGSPLASHGGFVGGVSGGCFLFGFCLFFWKGVFFFGPRDGARGSTKKNKDQTPQEKERRKTTTFLTMPDLKKGFRV